MPRRLPAILCAISLLFCTLIAVACVRSYWVADVWEKKTPDELVFVALHHARIVYATCVPDRDHPKIDRRPIAWRWRAQDHAHGPTWAHRNDTLGFGSDPNKEGYYDGPPSSGGKLVMYLIWQRSWFPLWPVLLLTAIAPALWITRSGLHYWRLRQSPKTGLCPTCSYDLRASKDRCPECGSPIPSTEPHRNENREQKP